MDDIDRYLALHRRTWSANTFDRYRRALSLFATENNMDLSNLSASRFLSWLESHSWGSSTQWVAYTAVKSFLSWCYGANHPALELRIKRSQPAPQRSLDVSQVQRLLASFDTGSIKGRRDLAICGILLDCALRASELCGLSMRYLDLKDKTIKVKVKGGKWMSRCFSGYTQGWLDLWISDRAALARPSTETVFCSVGGNTPGQALTREGLQCIMRSWAKVCDFPGLSPHDFRRTFGSLTTMSGAPEDIAMKGGGWSSHEVFRHYTVGVTLRAIEPYLPTKTVMESHG